MNNELCPYTVRPVGDIECNREHIIPDALGGPNGFALKTHALTNLKLGATVDSRLSNSEIMCMAAMMAGVRSRSGSVSWRGRGELSSDGSRIEFDFSKAKRKLHFHKPVVPIRRQGRYLAYEVSALEPTRSSNV